MPIAPAGPPASAGAAPQFKQPPMQGGQVNPQNAAQPALQGYNSALSSLQSALGASKDTTSGQQMQLGQQLQQNQGQVSQSLTNRGLGNTTIANTMQQAPLQTYNMGMANVQNQGALRQMQGYQNLAQAQMQGGQSLANMQAPYAQSNFAQQLGQQQQAQQHAQLMGSGAYQNLMGAQSNAAMQQFAHPNQSQPDPNAAFNQQQQQLWAQMNGLSGSGAGGFNGMSAGAGTQFNSMGGGSFGGGTMNFAPQSSNGNQFANLQAAAMPQQDQQAEPDED